MRTYHFISRRNLGLYGEIKFAELLKKKGFDPFFPYRDQGIDIVAIKFNQGRKVLSTYQVKSRNRSKRFGTYWFQLKAKDIQKNKAHYWIFAIFKEDNTFDFLRIPFTTISKWIKYSSEHPATNILGTDNNNWWLKIDNTNGNFLTVPKKGSITLKKYLFE